MELGLKGKCAVVTGGNTGLGAGICDVLAEEGMNIVINYLLLPEDAEKLADDLKKKYGVKCLPFKADVTKADEIDALYEAIEEKFGHADLLVNNAGIWPTTEVTEMDDDEWRKVIDINLTGPFIFSKRAINHYIKHDVKGHIVCVSSKSGFAVTSPGHAHYATAKGGINLMVKSLAREVSKKGIIVNGIAPGMVRTPLNEDKLSQEKWIKYYEERIPVGRISSAREVAYTVAFLASDKGMYISGAIVDVTGGMLI